MYYVLVLTLYFVCQIEGQMPEKVSNNCHGHIRTKRAKNYNGPPSRFYKVPPAMYPVNGPFSYTPPPGYEIKEGPQSTVLKPDKFNKRPTRSGLEDEDLRNIVKYLSKQDLDKVFELAREKVENVNVKAELSNYNYDFDMPDTKYNYKGRESINKAILTFDDLQANYEAALNNNGYPLKQKQFIYNEYRSDESHLPPKNIPWIKQFLEEETEVIRDTYMGKEIITTPNKQTMYIENDSDIAFTNKVPKIVKPESTSYKLENFAELPLMNYDSKLHKVNSYNVPHYTVISPNQKQLPNLSTKPSASFIHTGAVEKNQSEAHLRAIQIWTHKSKGTAYTLHEDGTLSLEKPTRHSF